MVLIFFGSLEKNLTMSKLKWASSDGNLVVEIDPATYFAMTDICSSAHPNETGGIVAGFYSRNGKIAYITQASTAPVDSNCGRTWFKRGVRNLQTWLSKRWKRGEEYYLGEWHYHPDHDTKASAQDKSQLLSISHDKKYACPEPVLLIIGGSNTYGWELSAYVAKAPKTFIELIAKSH
jgi:proteasome lid subunit RPN8/RPN11